MNTTCKPSPLVIIDNVVHDFCKRLAAFLDRSEPRRSDKHGCIDLFLKPPYALKLELVAALALCMVARAVVPEDRAILTRGAAIW